MSADPSKTKFSTSVIAITGLIGAIAGLLTVLHTTGVINLTGNSNAKKEKTEITKSAEPQKVEVIIKQEDKTNTAEKKPLESSSLTTDYQPVSNNLETIPPITNSTVNLTGYWYENAQGSRYYFNQDGYGKVSFQEYAMNEFGVAFVSAEGSGTIRDNMLSVTFLSYLGYTGTFQGNVGNNGATIDGIAAVPATGQSMRILMNRE